MVALLDQRVADALDLHSQVKHAHWNAKGPAFYSLHLMYDSLAKIVEEHADTLAERVVSLGGVAHGTLRMTSGSTTLPDAHRDQAVTDYLEGLIASFALHGKNVSEAAARAEDAGDRGSADLLTGHVRDIDKALFMLEAHLPAV